MAENTAARLHCLLKERIENPVPDQISGTAFGKGTFLDDVRLPSLFIPKRDAGFTPYNCAKPARRYVRICYSSLPEYRESERKKKFASAEDTPNASSSAIGRLSYTVSNRPRSG